MKRVFVVVCLAAAVVGCGSSSPSAPTASGPPNVAGNYSGTGTYTFIGLGRTLQCPVTTSVNQNGAQLSIAPLNFTGVCASLGSVPVGNATIDNNGSLGNSTQTLFISSCNGNYSMTASGGFFGNTLQFSFFYTAISSSCIAQIGNFSFTGNFAKS